MSEYIINIPKMLNFTISQSILELCYIVASILFIVGLKKLSSPDSARRGNILAAVGMILAIVATLIWHRTFVRVEDNTILGHLETMRIENLPLILGAIVVGTVLGWLIAVRVKMTAMPQLVSLFNGMGGGAAALIALMEFPKLAEHASDGKIYMFNGEVLVILLGLFIGSVSFAGSMIAFGKLDGKIGDIRSSVLRIVNIVLLVVILGLIVFLLQIGPEPINPQNAMFLIYIILGLSLLYGVLFVMPIGGADMPVVISLLNSFTGVAAAMGGFLYNNQAMLTGGILVGAAGMILTVLMCRAMNRSLFNVIVGAFGGSKGIDKEAGNIKEISINDAGVLLSYSQRVVIVPGYGLAAAQAQHLCNEMVGLLEDKGVEVKFAIHPVAGRMPGHMNVLLAEADVPYDKLLELEDINPEMPDTDVVVVIGANDVVNPAAEDDPGSPIYGMPIVQAHLAENVIILKRGMGKGYAAIENHLFFDDKTRMLFGDAKQSLQKLITEIKAL